MALNIAGIEFCVRSQFLWAGCHALSPRPNRFEYSSAGNRWEMEMKDIRIPFSEGWTAACCRNEFADSVYVWKSRLWVILMEGRASSRIAINEFVS
jgi:hypothetical protein